MIKNRRVLIVDDQEVNRQILGHILQEEYDIMQAENGESALELLREYSDQISAVFLDLIMPGMDGYTVLETMKADSLLHDIPVIIASQMDGEESESRVLAMGANDFVGKPYQAQIIRQRLKNLIIMKEASANLATAERDILTGLYDKRAFYRKVNDMLFMNQGREYDLIEADIEKFKIYNSAYGYTEGDRLLQYAADMIQGIFGETDALCARYESDHFFICISREEDVEERLLELHQKLHEYPMTNDIMMKFAIYHITDITIPVSSMCDATALALAQIKGQYDKILCEYDDSVRKSLMQEQRLESQMHEALLQGQFQAYYQPKYDIRNNCMVGAEALVRWIHPQMGVISPAEFIPLFEKNGFITEVDKYVWEEACKFISNMLQQVGNCVPISVNVSRVDIYHTDLPETLWELVKKYGLEAKYLHLEVTETAYTENTKQLTEVMERLKKYGFVIEMDDFGSGYSSLNILSELTIDVLKLDMKFIQNEMTHKNSNNIMNSVVNLAKWMNLLVIAEGVETQEQIDFLRELRCDFVQGYFYAKPMPKEEFVQRISYSTLEPLYDIDSFVVVDSTQGDMEGKKAGTILIVDDLKMNQTVLAESLEEEYALIKADNGAIAWNYLAENYDKISLVITDLYMPVMAGDELLAKMQEQEITREIPVIITSAKADVRLVERLKARGAWGFLRKPFEKEEALQMANDVIEEQQKVVMKKLREAENNARVDGMTKLYNRIAFENLINEYYAKKPNGRGVFIILDVDNFKMVNDTFGHSAGDDTIRLVADLLRECFRAEDLICRMGGDEFAVFVKERMSQDELHNRLENLRMRLRFVVQGMQFSCSIGACQSPKYASDYQSLYEKADMALLTAKRMGKNQFQVYGLDLQLPSAVGGRNLNWLLDEASDAIIVCNSTDYNLYYLNQVAAEQLAGKDKQECVGKKCYEAIFGFDHPCSHCQKARELTNEYQKYYATIESTGKTYLVKNKLIDWVGNEARIQFLQDVTKEYQMQEALRELLSRAGATGYGADVMALLMEDTEGSD